MRHARRRGHVCQRPLAAARSACRAHRAKSSNKADAAHTPAHPNGAVRFFVRTDLPALKYTNPNVRVAVTREPERSALTVTLGTRAESISMPPSASCPPPPRPPGPAERHTHHGPNDRARTFWPRARGHSGRAEQRVRHQEQVHGADRGAAQGSARHALGISRCIVSTRVEREGEKNRPSLDGAGWQRRSRTGRVSARRAQWPS